MSSRSCTSLWLGVLGVVFVRYVLYVNPAEQLFARKSDESAKKRKHVPKVKVQKVRDSKVKIRRVRVGKVKVRRVRV